MTALPPDTESKKARVCCDFVLSSVSHSYLDHSPFRRLFGRRAGNSFRIGGRVAARLVWKKEPSVRVVSAHCWGGVHQFDLLL